MTQSRVRRDQHDVRLARRIDRFAAIPADSFVWTRDDDQLFWLGRVSGPWYYDGSPDAAAVDLVHVRPCEWRDSPIIHHEAPAAVLATFGRGGRNFQRIRDPAVTQATQQLWRR